MLTVLWIIMLIKGDLDWSMIFKLLTLSIFIIIDIALIIILMTVISALHVIFW